MTVRKTNSQVEWLVSAGGVVHRRMNGHVEAVLCGRALVHSGEKDGGPGSETGTTSYSWSLAKGTPELGETLEETALREVREETGLEVAIEAPLGTIDYWFGRRELAMRYHKTVYYYLMGAVGGGLELHDTEFDVVQWFTSDEAIGALTYANEVKVLRRALVVVS